MEDFLLRAYPWIKSLHVISVVAWMAGMLYLPRLFVYHADVEPGSEMSETFKVMERRLLRAIINPAMGATFVFGILLLLTPGIVDWGAAWIWIKLAAITGMTAIHHVFVRWFKSFADDANQHTAKTFRIANEVPTLLMIVIIVMVIARPF